LDVVVLERGLVEGQARKILARRVALTEPGLSVAIETEVRVEIATALDRLVQLLLRCHLVAPALRARVGADDEDREEVATDEREDREQHSRADQDLAIEVRADLERIGRRWYRCDVVGRRLLDRLAGGGVLVVERPVAGAVELILGGIPWHAATKMSALPIRGDEPAGRMDEEELALEVQDRRVVRRFELGEDAVFRADG